jgi:iron-sulfur cluster repair protein YtfE (RIC family)
LTSDLEILRWQHDAAEEMAANIVAIVGAYRDEYDAIPIARLIGKLNALLRVHFAYEDSILYPRMIRSGDQEAAALAFQFDAEMGALALQFEDFARRWSGPTVIAGMFDMFREEATALFAALGARIERENDLLYPLARRVTRARAA